MAKQPNRAPARKQGSAPNPAPKTRKAAPREEATPGSVMWKLALILCTGLIIFSLLFASVTGGSKYVGMPEKDTSGTPTPPMVSIDPAVNISGSDVTPPPPPSPTPGVDTSAEAPAA